MTKDVVLKTINETKFQINLLNTSRAFITGQQLIKLGLPALGAGLDSALSEDDYDFLENQTFATVAVLITRQLDEVDLLEVVKELLAELKANENVVDFETYFRGELGLLINVIEFALRENYSSLFTDTSLMQEAMRSMKEFQTRLVPTEITETGQELE